jgi:hypothetical protein
MPAPAPIFVAGTGRSGTSPLADILGEHPQIHRIPMETHFIADPGGFPDLADALSIRYDPLVGDDALRRLSGILTVRLPGRAVRAADLPAGGSEVLRRPARTPRDPSSRHRHDVGGAAADAGKPAWCEKTPFSLLCMDFLWELVPAATIVHIKRHPVANQFGRETREFVERALDGVIPAMGYA